MNLCSARGILLLVLCRLLAWQVWAEESELHFLTEVVPAATMHLRGSRTQIPSEIKRRTFERRLFCQENSKGDLLCAAELAPRLVEVDPLLFERVD